MLLETKNTLIKNKIMEFICSYLDEDYLQEYKERNLRLLKNKFGAGCRNPYFVSHMLRITQSHEVKKIHLKKYSHLFNERELEFLQDIVSKEEETAKALNQNTIDQEEYERSMRSIVGEAAFGLAKYKSSSSN